MSTDNSSNSSDETPEIADAPQPASASGETEGSTEADAPAASDGPTWNIMLVRNGDFPANVSIPEGSTGKDLTEYLLNNTDDQGNTYLSGADPLKQTFIDQSSHAYGPADVLADGLMLNSVSKLGGASH